MSRLSLDPCSTPRLAFGGSLHIFVTGKQPRAPEAPTPGPGAEPRLFDPLDADDEEVACAPGGCTPEGCASVTGPALAFPKLLALGRV